MEDKQAIDVSAWPEMLPPFQPPTYTLHKHVSCTDEQLTEVERLKFNRHELESYFSIAYTIGTSRSIEQDKGESLLKLPALCPGFTSSVPGWESKVFSYQREHSVKCLILHRGSSCLDLSPIFFPSFIKWMLLLNNVGKSLRCVNFSTCSFLAFILSNNFKPTWED